VYRITIFYADVWLLVHFFFEYIILRIVQLFLGGNVSRRRVLCAAALAGSMDTLLLICAIPNAIRVVLAYVLGPILELFVCFRLHTLKAYVKAMAFLYLTTFCVGGFLNWIFEQIPFFKEYGYHFILLFAAVYFLSVCIQKAAHMVRKDKLEKQCIKPVEIKVNGKQICCSGLLDTGNDLYDPISKQPVMILEKQELDKYQIKIKEQQYRVIPYHSLGTKRGFLEGFVANEVCLMDEDDGEKSHMIRRENVVIGVYEGTLSKDGAYQMILHPMF